MSDETTKPETETPDGAETEAPEDDPYLAQLRQLLDEFKSHTTRVGEWSVTLRDLFARGELTPEKVAETTVQLALEFHATGLSLMSDFIELTVKDMEAVDEDDEDDEEEDDEDDLEEDDELVDAEPESVLVAGDAKQLLRTASEYQEMLESLVAQPSYDADARAAIQRKIVDAKASVELIGEITLPDEE